MFPEIYRYNTTSPSPAARSNCSCENKGDYSGESFEGEVVLLCLLVGVVGFILGTLITASVMSLVMTADRTTAGRTKNRQKVQPMPIDPEESDDAASALVLQESEDAQKAHTTKINRLQIRANQSTNARLNLRKQQLQIKMKRAEALNNVALFKNLTTEQRSTVLKKMKLKTFADEEAICEEGETATHFFIIAHVEEDAYVQITGKNGSAGEEDEEEVDLRQLRLYDYLGESALVKEKR